MKEKCFGQEHHFRSSGRHLLIRSHFHSYILLIMEEYGKQQPRGIAGTLYSWAAAHFLRTKRSVRLKIRGFDAQGTKIGVDRSDAVFTITKF